MNRMALLFFVAAAAVILGACNGPITENDPPDAITPAGDLRPTESAEPTSPADPTMPDSVGSGQVTENPIMFGGATMNRKPTSYHDILTPFDEIDRIVTEDVKNGFPGAQICVLENGEVIYKESWGSVLTYNVYGAPIPVEARKLVTDGTLYDIGGSTEVLTAWYAALHLISTGALSFDTKVVDVLGAEFADDTISVWLSPYTLDEVKAWKREMTVENLLRNQTGFPTGPAFHHQYYSYDGVATPEYNPLYNDTHKREKSLELVKKMPLFYAPGTTVRVSDVDAVVLTFVVESVTGKRLDAYLQELWAEIDAPRATFNPLMNGYSVNDCAATELSGNTRFGLVDFPDARRDIVWGEVHDETAFYAMEGVSGNAGLFGNAESLARIASTFLKPSKMFTDEVLDRMLTPTDEDGNIGMGWQLDFAADGSLQEFWTNSFTHCLISVLPEFGVVTVYNTNTISTPLTFLTDNFAEKDLAHAGFEGNFFDAAKQSMLFNPVKQPYEMPAPALDLPVIAEPTEREGDVTETTKPSEDTNVS